MLFSFIVEIGKVILQIISLLLPAYSTLPLPDWFYTNIVEMFSVMKLIVTLPIIRVVYGYFWLLFPVWLIFWGWNLIVKIIATIPGLNGLAKWKLK